MYTDYRVGQKVYCTHCKLKGEIHPIEKIKGSYVILDKSGFRAKYMRNIIPYFEKGDLVRVIGLNKKTTQCGEDHIKRSMVGKECFINSTIDKDDGMVIVKSPDCDFIYWFHYEDLKLIKEKEKKEMKKEEIKMGDKVLIISTSNTEDTEYLGVNDEMMEMIGKVYDVEYCNGEGFLEINGGNWHKNDVERYKLKVGDEVKIVGLDNTKKSYSVIDPMPDLIGTVVTVKRLKPSGNISINDRGNRWAIDRLDVRLNYTCTDSIYDKEDLKATEESIKKWEGICFEGKKDNGVSDCALCKKYKSSYRMCGKCPIFKFTGQPECKNTPYFKFRKLDFDSDSIKRKEKYHQAALEMLKFLTDKVLPYVKENMISTCPTCGQEIKRS